MPAYWALLIVRLVWVLVYTDSMPKQTILANVNVVSMLEDKVLSKRDVVISGTNIVSITKADGKNRGDCKVIDGSGKYVMPGLFDMHVHLDGGKYIPLFLMNGITCVRDLGSTDDSIFKLKRNIEEGRTIGPKLFVCGPILEGDPPLWDCFRVIKSQSTAIKVVHELRDKGVDFIKVYHTLPPDIYKVILRTARRLGLKVTGHIPNGLTPLDAIESGQTCIEHMLQITSYVGDVSWEKVTDPDYEGWQRATKYEVDEDRFHKFLSALGQHQAYVCPTLIVERQIASLAKYDDLLETPGIGYISEAMAREEWNPAHKNAQGHIKGQRPLWFKNYGVFHKGSKKLIRQLVEHGTLLAGTDTMNPFVIPGFSLSDELELLVESGLSPFQALCTATVNAARFLDVDDQLGTIEVGKTANIAVLDKNPLDVIGNVRTVNAIVLDGQYLDRSRMESEANKLKS